MFVARWKFVFHEIKGNNRLVPMLETDMIGEAVLVLVLFVAVRTDGHWNTNMFTEAGSHFIILGETMELSDTYPPFKTFTDSNEMRTFLTMCLNRSPLRLAAFPHSAHVKIWLP